MPSARRRTFTSTELMIPAGVCGSAGIHENRPGRGIGTGAAAVHATRLKLLATDLQLVLQGIDPARVKRSKRYRQPAAV